MKKHFLYMADPMCSWCWGFSPVIQRISATLGGAVPVRVIVGGIRPYTEHPMSDQDKSYVRNHWEHVHAASGQPFDFGFFDRKGFVYDSEPSCRAIVTSRQLDEAKTLPVLERIQRAFYAEGKNTVDEETLADLAAETGFDRAEFLARLTSHEAREETRADFRLARDHGVTGFPTLLAVDEREISVISAGFKTFESLADLVATWIRGGAAGSQ